MTEREWFAEQDPLVLLAFVQEQSGVGLLEGATSDPTSQSWGSEELYRSPIEPGHVQEAELIKRLHRYLLACCRAIWPLLPHEASRRGVEVTELYIEGKASYDDWDQAEYSAEGAAFFLELQTDDPEISPDLKDLLIRFETWRDEQAPAEQREFWDRYEADRREQIAPMMREVRAIPGEKLSQMVRAVPTDDPLTPRHLLSRAAYFAHRSICYPGITPRPGIIQRYPEFLSADLLRRHVRYPLHAQTPGPGHDWWARYGTRA